MRISIKVKPKSKQEKVEKLADHEFIVQVKAAPLEDKANQAAIKLLSEYFDIAKSRITIIKGNKARSKIVEIEE